MGNIISSTFRAAWWLPGGHPQTLWAPLMRRLPQLGRQREVLILPDGDELDLDWYGESRERIVVLLHGFTGSSNSSYMLGMQQALLAGGFTSVAVNFRGCSGRPNHLARSYHSGATEDLEAVVQSLRQRWPRARLAAVGYSLGGNLLLKWLGEQAAQPLVAAVAVSVPMVLGASVDRLNQGLSTIYQRRFLRDLRTQFEAKQNWLDDAHVEQSAILRRYESVWRDSITVRAFDHGVTAPLHGFASADDYYGRCSSRQFLRYIRTPTLIVHALDDPFMTAEIVPDAAELSDAVTLELCASGGHVGFVAAEGLQPVYWLETRVPSYLRNLFGY